MKFFNNRQLTTVSLVLLLGIAFFLAIIFPLSAKADISQNLRKGDSNPSIRELQKILNLDPKTRVAASGPGSLGNETEYFGNLTYAAVLRFQQKYSDEILAPLGLKAPTGFVGPSTRKIMNILASSLAPTPVPTFPASTIKVKPIIASVTPQIIAKSPFAVTITGMNFTPLGNTVLISSEPRNAYVNLPSNNNKIEIYFRASGMEDLKKNLLAQVPPAEYDEAAVKEVIEGINDRLPGTSWIPAILQVINANGESPPFTIYIDAMAVLLAQ